MWKNRLSFWPPGMELSSLLLSSLHRRLDKEIIEIIESWTFEIWSYRQLIFVPLICVLHLIESCICLSEKIEKKKEIEKKNIAFFGPQYVGSWIHLVPCFAFSSHVRVKFIRFDSWEIVRLEKILEIVIVSISYQPFVMIIRLSSNDFFPV